MKLHFVRQFARVPFQRQATEMLKRLGDRIQARRWFEIFVEYRNFHYLLPDRLGGAAKVATMDRFAAIGFSRKE